MTENIWSKEKRRKYKQQFKNNPNYIYTENEKFGNINQPNKPEDDPCALEDTIWYLATIVSLAMTNSHYFLPPHRVNVVQD